MEGKLPSRLKEVGRQVFPIESLGESRIVDGVRERLVKWLGYPESESSWEPADVVEKRWIVAEVLDHHPASSSGPEEKYLVRWQGFAQPTWEIATPLNYSTYRDLWQPHAIDSPFLHSLLPTSAEYLTVYI